MKRFIIRCLAATALLILTGCDTDKDSQSPPTTTQLAPTKYQVKLPSMSAKYISRFNDSECKPPEDQPNSHQRILVVEDEHDLRQSTAEVLIDAGYQVDVAENGGDAWRDLQLSKYDLLITDQFMPKVSGVELLKKIHAARMTLPVIMATGYLPTWEFAARTFLQPVKMLLKPYSFEKLLDMVKNVLPATVQTGDDIPLAATEAEPPLPPLPQLRA
jgi:CheY-like chemotaxis protein